MSLLSPLALPALPFLVALVLVLGGAAPAIRWLRSKNSVQPISPDAPEKHRLKHGTPTMGGLLIVGAVLLTVGAASALLPLLPLQRQSVWLVLGVFVGGGLIGLLDDAGKARKKLNKAGLSERVKLGLQIVVAAGFATFLALDPTRDTRVLGIDLGVGYFLLAALLVIGFGNAANFTDGLDGLAAGTTLIASGTLALVATLAGRDPQIALFEAALAGACGGFLAFNAYPARVFMGDTGSLAIGMGLSAAAIAAHQEMLLFIVGAVYVAEIASMMLQRYVFKFRRIRHGLEYAQKHRVFRRAPLHHHFEELGWHEVQVVVRFWTIALIFAALGIVAAPLLSLRPPQPDAGIVSGGRP
jgi:phospho-N-acetylmuramoyl-pentapeptide-transferase